MVTLFSSQIKPIFHLLMMIASQVNVKSLDITFALHIKCIAYFSARVEGVNLVSGKAILSSISENDRSPFCWAKLHVARLVKTINNIFRIVH